MAEAFHARGARIALADLDGAEEAAKALGGIGAKVDVTKEAEIAAFLDRVEAELGPVDVYVSNAGILRADAPSWDAAGGLGQGLAGQFPGQCDGRRARCTPGSGRG